MAAQKETFFAPTAGRTARRIGLRKRRQTNAVIVRAGVAAVSLAIVVSLAKPVAAQPSVEQFYKGKSIDVVIGYPPAG